MLPKVDKEPETDNVYDSLGMVPSPLIPALRRQRQADLQSEFPDSQGYTEKPYLKNKQTNKKRLM